MTLSRTIKRFAVEVRREARRNPEFAARLEAVFAAHAKSLESEQEEGVGEEESVVQTHPAAAPPPSAPVLTVNPVALFQREGAEGLRAVLADAVENEGALRALVSEHNLDPLGEASELGGDELVSLIVAQAQRRAERDSKLFDY